MQLLDKPAAVTRRSVFTHLTALALAAFVAGGGASNAAADGELNMLGWCDHADPKTFEPFEQKYGVEINLKEYEGTGVALAILEQSQPGDWDLMSIDMTDIKRLSDAGWFAPLKFSDYPFDDIWPEVRMFNVHVTDGLLYGVPEKFGYEWIAYNNTRVTTDEMRRPEALWDPKYKGRFGVYDEYFVIIQTIAVALGKIPSELSVGDLPEIGEKLRIVKDNAVMIGDIVTIQTALATGELDMVFGGAEWVVSGLHAERPELDWVLGENGGLRWASSMAIFQDSKRKDLATKFIQWNTSPEGQARLATSSCYWGVPANRKASLSQEQKKILRWDEQAGFLANSHPFTVPSDELDQAMIDLWTSVIQE